MENNVKRLFTSKFFTRKRCHYCNTKSRYNCTACSLRACEFHSCKRRINGKRKVICDSCHYKDVQEAIKLQNEYEMSNAKTTMNQHLVEFAKCTEEIQEKDVRIDKLLEKFQSNENGHRDAISELDHKLQIENIRVAKLAQTFNSIQNAIYSMGDNNTGLSEKYNKRRIEINQIKMEIDQMRSQEAQFSRDILSLAEQSQSRISRKRLENLLCEECQIKFFGKSFLQPPGPKPAPCLCDVM